MLQLQQVQLKKVQGQQRGRVEDQKSILADERTIQKTDRGWIEAVLKWFLNLVTWPSCFCIFCSAGEGSRGNDVGVSCP